MDTFTLQPLLQTHGIRDGIGNIVGYIDKLFPRLFNIFEIADVETPSCRPVSADVISYPIIVTSND